MALAPSLANLAIIRSFVLAALLVSGAAVAAPSPAAVAAKECDLHDTTCGLLTSAYRQIATYYLEPVYPDTIALAGMAALASPDRSFSVRVDDHTIVFLDQDRPFSRIEAPARDDIEGWASVTAAAVTAARTHVAAYATIDAEQFYQKIFDGIVTKLDRFTRYAGRDKASDQRASREGFGGIGVTLDYTDALPRVSSVVAGGPASDAGIHVDDRLVAIDNTAITKLNQHDAIDRLRGPVGTRVSISIQPPGSQAAVSYALDRRLIVPPSVTAEFDGAIAIFHVASFNVSTADDLDRAIKRMIGENPRALAGAILDLRDDPGGLLDQAAAVAGLFLDRGLIVSTRGRVPAASQHFEALQQDRLRGRPLVVLVNGGSASSAEIVAAALQDSGRAVVIGSSSYGKGTVQMVLPLVNDGELTLTWARLFSPGGYALQDHGVVPAFCTSRTVDPVAPPESEDTRVSKILAAEAQRTDLALRPRATLSDGEWSTLRNACPTETRSSSIDLRIARSVLLTPLIFQQALAPFAVNVAHASRPPTSEWH